MESNVRQTDILVVGGGGAGFRAAISAAQMGMQTTLISKGPLGRSGATPMAGADFTLDGRSMSQIEGLPGDPNDSPEKVFNDMVTQGCYLNNQKLVDQYIRRAPDCLKELIDWGITIKASDERMIFTSGTGIMDALVKKARNLGVQLIEDVAVLELIVVDGVVCGAVALDLRAGEFIRFHCRALILATGGWHKAFWPNTGMRDLSGEGIAMAYRAGAAVGNLEFITFCCNVFYTPPMWAGSIAPYVLSLICGGRLSNRFGEDVLAGYDPYLVEKGVFTEWNKSFLSYVTALEIDAGRGLENGGIYYSRGDVPWENIELVASVLFPKWRYKALDLKEWGRMLEANEPVEVGPAVEYFEGGIVVNDRFETSLSGLFAAGECTLGPFGANRVFAAITEMLAHGADAGRSAAAYASTAAVPSADEAVFAGVEHVLTEPLTRSKGERPAMIRRDIQKKAHQYLGPIRNRDGLEKLLAALRDAKVNALPFIGASRQHRVYNKEWIDALELVNLLQLLEIAAQSALNRTESRGVHFRDDFPDTDNDAWLNETIVRRVVQDMEVIYRPVTVTSMSLPSGKTPYLDFMREMMMAHSDTGGKH